MEFTVVSAETPCQISLARDLILDYVRWLGLDLGFQDFSAEMAQLPGAYTPPQGGLWLLVHDPSSRLLSRADGLAAEAVAGVIALRPLTQESGPSSVFGEVKRLWVRPEYRSRGCGERLVHHALSEARQMGYRRLYLDTLAHMHAAISLYRRMGFVPCDAYYDNPLPDVVYLSLELTPLDCVTVPAVPSTRLASG